MLKTTKENDHVPYKGRPIRVTHEILNAESESQNGLARFAADSKRPQVPVQTTLPSKTFNCHIWRK